MVSSDSISRFEMSAISSTAAWKNRSLVFDGLVKPLIFLTNWSEAARISSSVTGGSKLNKGRIFLHTSVIINRCHPSLGCQALAKGAYSNAKEQPCVHSS